MDFENLFALAISALIEINGGSLESAMDEMRLKNPKTRKKVREYLEWDEE